MSTEVIFEILSDGVAFIGPSGNARFTNHAARELVGPRMEPMHGHPKIQEAIGKVRDGTAKPPLNLAVDLPRDGDLVPLDVTILDWKSGGGFIFIIKRREARRSPTEGLDVHGTLELIRNEIYAPLRELVDAAAPAAAAGGADSPGARAADAGAKLLDLLDVFHADEILEDERMLISELIEASWPSVQPFAGSRFITFAMRGITETLPPLYGSRRLLLRAMSELMKNAVLHATPGKGSDDPSVVDIEAQLDGDWVLMRFTNRGLGFLAKLQGREFLPFSRPKQAARLPNAGPGIGLALVRRIVELHGGIVDVSEPDTAHVMVTLRLRTGAPPMRLRQQEIAQAEKYAHDLAVLLARRQKRSAEAA